MGSLMPAHDHHFGEVADPNDPLGSSRSVTRAVSSVGLVDQTVNDDQTGESPSCASLSHLSGSIGSPERRSPSRPERTRNDSRATSQGPRDRSDPMTRHERSSGGASTDRHPRGEPISSNNREKVIDLIDRAAARFSSQNRGPRATFRGDPGCEPGFWPQPLKSHLVYRVNLYLD